MPERKPMLRIEDLPMIGITRRGFSSNHPPESTSALLLFRLACFRIKEVGQFAGSSLDLVRSSARRMRRNDLARVFGLQGCTVFPLLAKNCCIGYLSPTGVPGLWDA
jgi:hypothetical protein